MDASPDWNGKCRCSHIRGRSRMSKSRSSCTWRGCEDQKRTRQMPGLRLRVAIGVATLAKQPALPHALVGKATHVIDDVGHRATALGASDEGHDAKAADLVAAEDHRHVSGEAVF